jgi:hypothetical protein
VDTPGWLATTACLPGIMPSTGCGWEKVLHREAVHNGRELSTLGISRATLHVRLLGIGVAARAAMRPDPEDAAWAPEACPQDTSVWRTARHRALYDSIVCSTTDGYLDRICRAIEELAGTEPGEPTADDAAARLAAIWALIADANPELAKRLPGYLSAAE